MSPLLLVGILVITSTLADVKHVLDGSAHPPDPNSFTPHSINQLSTPYWWMDANSPLKAAYDYYKKCATKSNCLSPVNPAAPAPQPFVPQDTVTIDVKKNPFLNGNFNPQGGSAHYNEKEAKIDIKKNPFLSGSVLTTGNGSPVVKDQNGFLGVQPVQPFGKKPGFATTHPLEQKKKPGFATSHPLDQHKGEKGVGHFGGQQNFLNVTVECKGAGFACVEKRLCLNGVANTNGEGLLQVRSDVRYCHEDTEVCCQMNNLNEITAGKSSTIKFAGGAGFSPGLIHVQPLDVKPDIVFAGEHGHHSSSSSKSIRDTSLSPNSVFSSTADYSDVKFDSDVRFASTFQGPAYLPPIGPTTPAPRPFETKQPNINQQYVPSRPSTQKYLPPPPPTTPRPAPPTFKPAPSTTYRPAPSPTYKPAPSPTYRPAPSPTYKPAPSPTYRPAPSPTYRPAPSTTFRPAPSTTFRPAPPVTFRPAPTTSREYLPPRPTTSNQPAPTLRPYQPSTPKPFVPQPTPAPNPAGGYEYPKPTPTFGYPSTPRQDFGNSNVNNQYIPPPKKPSENPDQSFEAANVDGAFVRPTTPRTQFPQFQGELNTAPPPGCAAALKCVQEIYCTAEGVVSPVPVVLTKEQELSRVPTTVCQDTESGIIGKCCRDPNYKDPWPSANLVDGVDDGQYKEDDNIGQYQQDLQRNVRSDKGGPRQDLSSVRNTNVQAVPQPKCGERHLNTNPPGPGPLDANFAEIPWQAMVLRDTNRSLLCGGAIIRRDAVLTAAHCVEGLETSDILIKGGEWKLGIDEEPLPFQIVKVAVVVRHPQYQKGSFVNDLALLILEEKLRPAKNIGTLCLPQPNQIPTQNCIATGWGKRILQLHAKGAIMHGIDVKIMDNQQCQDTLSSTFQHASSNYSPNTLCGYSDIDQCRVDYGSALACSTENGYTLSGIYAWDTGCKQPGQQIGGYIAPDVDWIETTLAKPLRELKN